MTNPNHEEKLIKLQHQLRQNQQDLQDYLKDLNRWEDEIKQKETELPEKDAAHADSGAILSRELPPIRNSLTTKRARKKKKAKENKSAESGHKKIHGYDYRAWDQFDVERALKEVDDDNKLSSSEYETDEEWEVERKKSLASQEKEKGNEHLKQGQLEAAIECYTRGMQLDPTNALLPANRALALLKLERFAAAEVDCTAAVTLDPLYVKAYLRRASSCLGLRKYEEACADYQSILRLEPDNKLAKSELAKLDKEIARNKEALREMTTVTFAGGIVKPIHKPVEMQSKKPLVRINIQELGMEETPQAKLTPSQSRPARQFPQRDQERFEHLVGCSVPASAPPHGTKLPAVASRNSTLSADLESPRLESTESGQQQPSGRPKTGDQMELVASGSCVYQLGPQPDTKGSRGSGCSPVSASKSVPVNSFQFQADFKCLRNDLAAFYEYLKRINPSSYPHLFGECLDSSILTTIIRAIKEYYVQNGENYLPILENLPHVKRFSTTIMFLSKSEKQVLHEVFDHLKTSLGVDRMDVEKLTQIYGVS